MKLSSPVGNGWFFRPCEKWVLRHPEVFWEDCSDPDSWCIHMLLLRGPGGIKEAPRNCVAGHLPVASGNVNTILPTFTCPVFLTDSQRGTVEGQVAQRVKIRQRKQTFLSPLVFFPFQISWRRENISRVSFSAFSKQMHWQTCANLPTWNTKQTWSRFKVSESREDPGPWAQSPRRKFATFTNFNSIGHIHL